MFSVIQDLYDIRMVQARQSSLFPFEQQGGIGWVGAAERAARRSRSISYRPMPVATAALSDSMVWVIGMICNHPFC